MVDCRILTSNGFETVVSEEDFELASRWRWFANPKGTKTGGHYALRASKGRTFYLHRVLLSAERGQLVDHINGNGLDNRRSNLRLATPSQNAANRRSYGSASGYRGVYPDGRGRFVASISNGNRAIAGGRFNSAEEAARHYDLMAQARFGDFAVLNFGRP